MRKNRATVRIVGVQRNRREVDRFYVSLPEAGLLGVGSTLVTAVQAAKREIARMAKREPAPF